MPGSPFRGPIILLQLALTAVAVLGRQRFAIAAALLLTATCALSTMSGLFDGDLFAEGLGPGEKAFQIVLISWMALVGLLAALRTIELLRCTTSSRPRWKHTRASWWLRGSARPRGSV